MLFMNTGYLAASVMYTDMCWIRCTECRLQYLYYMYLHKFIMGNYMWVGVYKAVILHCADTNTVIAFSAWTNRIYTFFFFFSAPLWRQSNVFVLYSRNWRMSKTADCGDSHGCGRDTVEYGRLYSGSFEATKRQFPMLSLCNVSWLRVHLPIYVITGST